MATIKLADGRGELYQWGTGRKVVIDDESIKRVHYQNRFYGRTIDVDVSGGFAIIPDRLLQSCSPLVVFAWSGNPDDGYTKIEKTFEVNRRNKPSDYVFTPVEQKTLGDLQKQIGDLAGLQTDAKDNLVAAINEAAASGGSSVPKPLTYDYMPEGYPSRTMQTATLMEEQKLTFSLLEGAYLALLEGEFQVAAGQTYTVKWDGTEYECVGANLGEGMYVLGNLSIGFDGADTGEPFVYIYGANLGEVLGRFATLDTSASHTISVKRIVETVTPMAEEYLPENIATKSDVEATQKVLDGVFSSVATFTFDKQTSGRDTFVFNAFNYYKISDFNPATEDVISFKGTNEFGDKQFGITAGNNCAKYGFFIVVASAGYCSLPITEAVTGSFTAPSAGLYASYEKDNAHMTAGTAEFTLKPSNENYIYITGLFLKSCTHGSTKKFKITVDDAGTLKATEVTG